MCHSRSDYSSIFFFLKKKNEILVNFSAKDHLVSPNITLKLTLNVERSFKYR